jgi:spore coat protein CotH
MTSRFAFILSIVALAEMPLFAQPAVDALFDHDVLHDVRITMSADDWAQLRARFQENINFNATLTIDGETVPDSSIRSRGSGTRNGVKPGLRVDFQRTVRTQRFRGFKVLVLDNMYNDPSFLRERLAFSVFEEMGIRVPRESFARLTVNGEYWGLYAIVEPIDEIFVQRHVDAGGGNLFEYNVPSASPDQIPVWDFTLMRGNTVDAYIPEPFEPKTNEDDLDGTALLDFIRTVSEAPDETFVEEVSAFVDPRVLLTYYAVEVATAEVDGLTGFFGINNFYLYQLQGTRRFLFIPWDHDFNFTAAHHGIYHGSSRNRLIQRLLRDPELAAFYRETLQSVMNRFVNPAAMNPQIDFMVAQIRPSVLEDTKRRGGDDPVNAARTFDEAVEHIRAVIAGRGASVDAQLLGDRRRPARH